MEGKYIQDLEARQTALNHAVSTYPEMEPTYIVDAADLFLAFLLGA